MVKTPRLTKNSFIFIFPGMKNALDDPRINPMAPGAPSLAGERLLVCTASEDQRAPRGRAYCNAVRASGWHGEMEWDESNGRGTPSSCQTTAAARRLSWWIEWLISLLATRSWPRARTDATACLQERNGRNKQILSVLFIYCRSCDFMWYISLFVLFKIFI
jgi:hypothetical protein